MSHNCDSCVVQAELARMGVSADRFDRVVALAGNPNTGKSTLYAALAAPKTYLTLHLMPVYGSEKLARQLAERFHSAGKRLDIGKGCIRFHSADDLALDAIAEVIGAVPVDQWIEIARSSRTGSRR